MAYKEHPIVGDTVYGGRLRLPSCGHELTETLRHFPRQALHAEHLGLQHPRTGEFMQWNAPLPQDMRDLLTQLERDKQNDA
jgi:23S rRNA pseudouridine1911/1915/1917 synthase